MRAAQESCPLLLSDYVDVARFGHRYHIGTERHLLCFIFHIYVFKIEIVEFVFVGRTHVEEVCAFHPDVAKCDVCTY